MYSTQNLMKKSIQFRAREEKNYPPKRSTGLDTWQAMLGLFWCKTFSGIWYN